MIVVDSTCIFEDSATTLFRGLLFELCSDLRDAGLYNIAVD